MALEPIVVLVTVPDEKTAARIAGALVFDNLAACAQVSGPIRSFYRWKGKIEDDREFLLTIKTVNALFPALESAIIEKHPYEVPQIVALPITRGHEPYLRWIGECATGPGGLADGSNGNAAD